ncbi:MAG: homocysteine S-methyltransferase family protein [Thermoanaerobaculia bacterium]
MSSSPGAARARLKAGRPLLLDAAMGSELQRRGADTRLPLWSARALIEDPELVARVHREEVAAGADILTANTFRTHGRTLAKAGLAERAEELTRLALELAREAARESPRTVLVAGSLAPLEDCYRPDLVPGDDALEREHGAQARRLAAAGADLLLLETHNTVREVLAAARAARSTGLPYVASFVTDGNGRLLSGEPLADAVAALSPLEPDAVGVNCVPARRLSSDLEALAAAAPEAGLTAYANLGLPADGAGWAFTEELAPAEYAEAAAAWISPRLRIVGGCCGTTPAHTAALRGLLDSAGNVQRISIASPNE